MSKFEKLRQKIMEGRSDANINFDDLRKFLLDLGFEQRIKGTIIVLGKQELSKSRICNVMVPTRNPTKCGR